MKSICIQTIPGFSEWRAQARMCILNRIPPSDIVWHNDTAVQPDIFAESDIENVTLDKPVTLNVPKYFLEVVETAICHRDPQKLDLLYRLLWRQVYEMPQLLKLLTDDDVLCLNKMVKAVRKDAYKITAFLRFREIKHNDEEHFIAWYEPEHYTLERVLPFFQTRFRNMRWSILTPYRAAHWNKEVMICEDNPDPGLYPKHDQVEGYWLTYYANIFNPARVKKQAMLNQMPKKYWKTMPETSLIPEMLRTANEKAYDMILRGQNTKS